MNNLKALATTLSSEEQKQFVSYLEKKNKRNDTKNIQLFKHLINNNLNTSEICIKLYNTNKSNAYHALRKRLYQSIIDYIANISLEEENSIEMQIIKNILAARKCLVYKEYKIAFKILDKAESLAEENHLFPFLNEIYHTKIQYSHALSSNNLNHIIEKFKSNQKNHFLEDELNIVYAKIRDTLNNITHQGSTIDFQTILNKILSEHHIQINESLSFKALYQIMSIIGFSAFATNNYLDTESFLLNSYKTITQYKDREKSAYYHIQILYIIANTLFRNKKFEESLRFLHLMHSEMQKHRKKYYSTFKLKFNLLYALNLNYTNKQEDAIVLLEPLLKTKHNDMESVLDITLSLIMFYFQKEDYKQAYSLIVSLYHTDQWYTEKAGKEWVIKKNLIEILLHLELNNIDVFESRLLSFKRSYFNYLKDIKQHRVITYLSLVETYYKKPEIVTSDRFKTTVEKSFKWVEKKREDIFVMSFYAWLKSKMEKQSLYKTTLNLIQDS